MPLPPLPQGIPWATRPFAPAKLRRLPPSPRNGAHPFSAGRREGCGRDGKIGFMESDASPLPEADKARPCALLPNTRLCVQRLQRVSRKGKPPPNPRIAAVGGGRKATGSSEDNLGALACWGQALMKGYWGDEILSKSVHAGLRLARMARAASTRRALFA